MCILSVLVIILLCPWHRGCPLLKSNPIFSLELVVPITWMGYSQHLGKWELLCYFGVHISWRVLSAEAFQRLDLGCWDEFWRQEGSNQARP